MVNVKTSRKKIFILFAALTIAGILVILGNSTLTADAGNFGKIGPLKKVLIAYLSLLFFYEIDLYFSSTYERKAAIYLALFLGITFFSLQKLVDFYHPNSSLSSWFGRFQVLGIVLLSCGIMLELSTKFSDSFIQKISESIQNRKITFLLISIFLVISLIPLIKSGYYWDDSFFSASIPFLRIKGESIGSEVLNEIIKYGKMGRINPFATFQFLVFYIFPNAVSYKCYLILLTILDCFLFYKFIKEWTENSTFAEASLFIVILCMQIRIYHDPLVSYYGLMQTMFAEEILSLFFFTRYLRKAEKKYLILSLVFFTINLLSYEMAYPLILLWFLLAWSEIKNFLKTIKNCLPFLLIEIILFSASMFFRTWSQNAGTAYAGTTMSLSLPKAISAWMDQSLSPFPLIYQLSGNDSAINSKLIPFTAIFNQSPEKFLSDCSAGDFIGIFCACLFFIGAFYGKNNKRLNSHQLKSAAIFGILLIFLPGLTIALSEKYQGQLILGIGYIPVYFEYFGAALLILCLIEIFRKNSSKVHSIFPILLGVFCAVYALNQQNNRRIIEILNQNFVYPRQAGEDALRSGLLKKINASDPTIVSDNTGYIWESGYKDEDFQTQFYSYYSGQFHHVINVKTLAEQSGIDSDLKINFPSDTYLIAYNGTKNLEFSKIGLLTEAKADNDMEKLDNPFVKNIYFFVRNPDNLPLTITFQTRDGKANNIPLSYIHPAVQTDQGSIYRLEESKSIFFDSIGLAVYQ